MVAEQPFSLVVFAFLVYIVLKICNFLLCTQGKRFYICRYTYLYM
jgi:hypothetical protein